MADLTGLWESFRGPKMKKVCRTERLLKPFSDINSLQAANFRPTSSLRDNAALERRVPGGPWSRVTLMTWPSLASEWLPRTSAAPLSSTGRRAFWKWPSAEQRLPSRGWTSVIHRLRRVYTHGRVQCSIPGPSRRVIAARVGNAPTSFAVSSATFPLPLNNHFQMMSQRRSASPRN